MNDEKVFINQTCLTNNIYYYCRFRHRRIEILKYAMTWLKNAINSFLHYTRVFEFEMKIKFKISSISKKNPMVNLPHR